jgi:hypothetical protein
VEHENLMSSRQEELCVLYIKHKLMIRKHETKKKNSEGIDDPYVWTKEKAYKEIKFF